MGVILGIDIGGSGTKIVGLREDGSLCGKLRVTADSPVSSLYGALGSFLTARSLRPEDLSRVVLTGVGAASIRGDVLGIPTETVDEFSAIAEGGLFLTGRESAVVVSMGTGTAFLWAERGAPARHLIGSGVGGGTLQGLGKLLLGTESASALHELSSRGDLAKIDLTIGKMSEGKVGTLPPETTAANFASLSENASREDIALGLVNLVLQSIGTMSVLACRICHSRTAVLIGALTAQSAGNNVYELFSKLYDIEFIIPEDAAFATAIGAVRCGIRQ